MSLDELTDYKEIHRRPTPIRYDILKLSDEHRKFDGLIRRYWSSLHPLVRDLFTSFASEFQYLLTLASDVEKAKDEEINQLRTQMVEKLNEMNSELATFQSEYETSINLKDDTIKQLEFETIELLNQINTLSDELKSARIKIQEKDELIVSQKEQIHTIHQEMQEKSIKNEEITNTIATVEMFTSQLDLLEKEMVILESEKANASEEISTLKETIQRMEASYRENLEEKNQKLQSMKNSLEKIYREAEKNKAETKAAKKRNIANEERIISLEMELKKLSKEFNENKQYLDNQVRINKAYHALTLKVIERSKDKAIKDAETKVKTVASNIPAKEPEVRSVQKKVPDLLSQIGARQPKHLVKNENIEIAKPVMSKLPETIEEVSKKNIVDESVPEKNEVNLEINENIQEKIVASKIQDNKNIMKNKMETLLSKENPIKNDLKQLLKQNVSNLQSSNENKDEILEQMKNIIQKEENDFKKVLADFPSVPKKIKQKERRDLTPA